MTSRLGHSSPANNPALGDIPKLPADKERPQVPAERERPQVLDDCSGEAVVKKGKNEYCCQVDSIYFGLKQGRG